MEFRNISEKQVFPKIYNNQCEENQMVFHEKEPSHSHQSQAQFWRDDLHINIS